MPKDFFPWLHSAIRVKLGDVRILTVNFGSSSLKIRIVDHDDSLLLDDTVLIDRGTPSADFALAETALARALEQGPSVDAVGHRIVHGGTEFIDPILIDTKADKRLERLADLAPLHNPPALALIAVSTKLRADLPNLACFDTSFHANLPEQAFTYALPDGWSEKWGLRRFGFHGLSHAWASRRASQLLGRSVADVRLVTAHLGSGASLAAVAGGRSVDTTMGFTPLDGLVMATRPGSIDPGLVLWMIRHSGLTVEQVDQALESKAGLLGLSGISGDLREVLSAADAGSARSKLAYRVLLHRLCSEIAAMVAALGGFDGLVFTGGSGEGSARLRMDACAALKFLGIECDASLNDKATGDRLISEPGAPVATAVVSAREDLEIARQVRAVLSTAPKGSSRSQERRFDEPRI